MFNLQDAIEELYLLYYKDLLNFIYYFCQNKQASEDILQNTFIKVMKGIKTFKGKSSIKTWIFAIAKNEAFRYLSRVSKTPAVQEEMVISHKSVEETLILKENFQSLIACLNQLESEKKSLVILRLVNELSFKEIGDILNHSETWARVNYMRTRLKIIKEMGDEGYGK